MPWTTAGWAAETVAYPEQLGVSAIELGTPFSDPVADGLVIEEAGLRSLANGSSTAELILRLQQLETQFPLILMTYLNPIYQYGLERPVADLADTAVKGLIIPDLPHEHKGLFQPLLSNSDIALIPLVSLTTGMERQRQLVAGTEGLVYAVAVNGVTGRTAAYRDDLDRHLAKLSDLAGIPVLTGFGVSNLADITCFNQVSDGVSVGSNIVRALHLT